MKEHTKMTPTNEAKTGNTSTQQNEPNDSAGEGNSTLATQNGHGAPQPNPAQVDFSEFLWMEFEEQFDEQVLRELEDEEVQNFYFNLTEAENEFEAEVALQDLQAGSSAVAGAPPQGGDSLVQQITSGLSQMNFTSRFNPDAAEFVPRTQSSSVLTSEANKL